MGARNEYREDGTNPLKSRQALIAVFPPIFSGRVSKLILNGIKPFVSGISVFLELPLVYLHDVESAQYKQG